MTLLCCILHSELVTAAQHLRKCAGYQQALQGRPADHLQWLRLTCMQIVAVQVISEARQEAQQLIAEAKAKAQEKQTKEVDAVKSRIDKELASALATLDKERDNALNDLDSQVGPCSCLIAHAV